LNVHKISYVTQIEIRTAGPLITEPNPFQVEIAIAKLKNYKPRGGDQILAEMIQAGDETLRSEILKLITSVWSKEELPDQWKESIIVPIYKKGDKIYCSNYRGISLLSTSTFYPISFHM
jgi:hypothetical protein